MLPTDGGESLNSWHVTSRLPHLALIIFTSSSDTVLHTACGNQYRMPPSFRPSFLMKINSIHVFPSLSCSWMWQSECKQKHHIAVPKDIFKEKLERVLCSLSFTSFFILWPEWECDSCHLGPWRWGSNTEQGWAPAWKVLLRLCSPA